MIFNVEPRNSPGKDSFAYWEDFLSEEDLDYLSNCQEWKSLHDAHIGGSSSGGSVNKNVRETGVAWLTCNDQTRHIWEKISCAVSEVNANFFRFDLTGFYEPLQLGLYHSGNNGHYNWHTDASMRDGRVPRKLSMALMLSDPSTFEGGELQLKTDNDEPITVQQKRGRAWFFPSYVLHRVTPVTKGFRQSAVLWIGGPEFR